MSNKFSKALLFSSALVAAAAVASSAMAADALNPNSTSAAGVNSLVVSSKTASYVVRDSASTVVGTFTYNETTSSWNDVSGWTKSVSGTSTVFTNNSTNDRVVFDNAPTNVNVGTTAAGTDKSAGYNSVGFASSYVGTNSTVTGSVTETGAAGVNNVTLGSNNQPYTYFNNANNALNVATNATPSTGTVNGTTVPATINSAATPSYTGSVTVTNTPAPTTMGSYTATFTGSSTGTVAGSSTTTGPDGLTISALTGSATYAAATGITTANVTATPVVSITKTGITTNALTVTGATVTNGINNSGARIQGVGAGTATTDAVNLGQLNALEDSLVTEFSAALSNLRGDMNSGISSALAAANLPALNQGQKGNIGIAIGGYDGETAFAVGANFRIGEQAALKASITSDSNATGFGVGASWGW